MDKSTLLIYIRSELNSNEYRCPIIPLHIPKLIEYGYIIYVESSTNRIYNDDEYKKMGAIITNKKWYSKEFNNGLIIGLKELDNLNMLDNHNHIYFSHSYKNQINSKEILTSFKKSNSILYDFEYFLDDNNRRLIGFGYYAGYIGCGIGLLQFFTKRYKNINICNLKPYDSKNDILDEVKNIYNKNIYVGVIGFDGNCGKGVINLLDKLDIKYIKYGKNDPKVNLESLDIIFNCIKLDIRYNETWIDKYTKFIKPITIIDISCDYTQINNPIKLNYNATSLKTPVCSLNEYVDIIAIDNLPSLLPKDSSDKFSDIYINLLLSYNNNIWKNNKNIYYNTINKL
jgi:saccharopine dehydrogenase (NAD+, L-lysine-forming)